MTNHSETGKRFARVSEDILRTLWRMNPVEATILGIHDYDDTLGDLSLAAIRSHTAALQGYLTTLRTEIDPTVLDPDDELNYQIALSLVSSNLIMLEHQRPWMLNPSMYPFICIWGCFGLLARRNGDPRENARFILSRMREVPDFLAASKSNIESPVPVFTEYAQEVTQGGRWFFESPFAEIAACAGSLEGELLRARDQVVTAFEDYGRWLSEGIASGKEGDFAVGEHIYRRMLSEEHHLPYSPTEIVEMAEDAFREAESQISELARSIDSSLSWQDVIARLKEEHPTEDGVVAAYREAFESAKAFVVERGLVTLAPGEHLSIVETPPFERAIVPYAGYFPPAPFGRDRRGRLWVTPINASAPEALRKSQLQGHCIYSIPIIAIHEGYPGHHVQLTRAMDSHHQLRKQAMNNLLVEGWALYCEQMMYEQGFYTDPRVRLFQLKDILWRACRVVIDVGIHTGGMTLGEAVRLLVDKARLEESNAVAEVKRYSMCPTQPMSYLIGEMLILDLREQLRQSMGSAFSLKEFHDRLLSYGSIPMPLIAARMASRASSLSRSAVCDEAYRAAS